MDKSDLQTLKFRGFELDLAKGLLLRDGDPIPIKGKTFETLCVLVCSEGRIVSREELMDALWPDAFVEENNLNQHISALRRILGNGASDTEYIQTVPRRGYRFLPEVTHLTAECREAATESYQTKAREESKGVSTATATVESKPDAPARPRVESVERSRDKTDNGNGIMSVAAVGIEQPIARPRSMRRRGLGRGLRCLIWGTSIAFVFLVLQTVLQIYAIMTFESRGALPPGASTHLTDTFESLVGLLFIPVILGYFLGLGLILYGVARIIYAMTQRGHEPGKVSLVEKFLVLGTIAAILAVAIPNLLASRKIARRTRQLQQQQLAK